MGHIQGVTMPDSDISPNIDPEDVLQNPGATDLSDPSASITGALTDYANRPQPPGNSLGLLMDDQQMRDAGVHPEQTGAPPSVIDATGASNTNADPADGYAKVARLTRGMVTGAHAAASGVSRLAGVAASDPMVAGLKTLNTIYSVPLSAAEGTARGATDLRNGAPLGETILGNGLRTGLVIGASRIPVVGPGAAFLANKYLPDGAAMGHGIIQGLSDPEQSRAALSAIQ
jgi:hypothetical protein